MIPALTAIAESHWFSIAILFAGLAWIWWTTRPKPIKEKEPPEPESLLAIVIQKPDNGGNVNFRDIVRGTTNIPDSSLQALVYSGDNLWYRQKDVRVTGIYWEVECQFGDENSSLPAPYKVVVISPVQQIPRSIPEIPPGVTESKRITVKTKKPLSLQMAVEKLIQKGKEQGYIKAMGYALDYQHFPDTRIYNPIAKLIAEYTSIYGRRPSSSFDIWEKISEDIILVGEFKKFATELYSQQDDLLFNDLGIRQEELDKVIEKIMSSDRPFPWLSYEEK